MNSRLRARHAACVVATAALAVVAGCGATSGGQAEPAPFRPSATGAATGAGAKSSEAPKKKPAPSTKTVYVQPPDTRTVYVPPPAGNDGASSRWYAQPEWIRSQPWIEITPGAGQTPCQWLHANGYSYPEAFAAWAQRGYPPNWSATNDGYPCQRSYGMQH